jgi:hypothetical protein
MSVSFVESSNHSQQSHSLQNIDNYKSEFSCTSPEIFSKYIGIISEYIVNCSDTISIQNDTYYKYVIIKGLETIAHVFRMLLLYTKNLNVTYYHCQKSFYYYVEFISQIGDNNHSFLQLNSRDASLFVYKKTIYEINQEHRRTFMSTVQDNITMNNVEIMIELYNRVIIDRLETLLLANKTNANANANANAYNITNANANANTNTNANMNTNVKLTTTTPSQSVVNSPKEGVVIEKDDKDKDKDVIMKNDNKSKKCNIKILSVDKEAIKFAQIVLNVSLNGDEKYYYDMLNIIKYFFNSMHLHFSKHNIDKYDGIKNMIVYIDTFIKKIKKNKDSSNNSLVDLITIDHLEKRFKHDDHDTKFETLTPLRYINWLIQ